MTSLLAPRSPCALLSRGPSLTGHKRQLTFWADDKAEMQLLWAQATLKALFGIEAPLSVVLRRALSLYVRHLWTEATQPGSTEGAHVGSRFHSHDIRPEVRQKFAQRLAEMKAEGALPDAFHHEVSNAAACP